MKQAIKYVMFLMFCLFFIDAVKALIYSCEYDFNDGEFVWTFEYDNEIGSYKNKNEDEGNAFVGYKDYEYYFSQDEIKLLNDNECPILYMSYEKKILKNNKQEFKIYTDSYVREKGGSSCVNSRDAICLKNFLGMFQHYYTGTLTGSAINKDNKEVSTCPSFKRLYDKIELNYKSYKNCTSEGCSNYLIIADENISKIKTVCNNMLSYRDYYESYEEGKIPIQDECIKNCLNFSEQLDILKTTYGISDSSSDDKICGFSEKLIIYIANIIKWVKYLIPVVVIVLGILDFIKAIAAGKDDEMKKAQGSFVKRLIAAALIFIVPFIIEFVLDKMGFGTNGCGIIDL